MKEFAIDPGDLRERLAVLTLDTKAPNQFVWKQTRSLYGAVTLGTGRNLFSGVGIGARDAKVLLRYDPYLSEANALLWRGRFLFLSALIPQGRQHLEASVALVDPVDCRAEHFEGKLGVNNQPQSEKVWDVYFPAVLTEKYAGYDRENAHATVHLRYVLVTPKAIALTPGDLVHIGEGAQAKRYHVQLSHTLDTYKNEYEIAARRDV